MQTMIETVTFGAHAIHAGQIDENILALGFLAALASATGRPFLADKPVFERESDWSDYDYPREFESYHWGDQFYGLKALTSGHFYRDGKSSGHSVFWVFSGLPVGLNLQGQSTLHSLRTSSASLTIESSQCEQNNQIAKAFREALKPWDELEQPNGQA